MKWLQTVLNDSGNQLGVSLSLLAIMALIGFSSSLPIRTPSANAALTESTLLGTGAALLPVAVLTLDSQDVARALWSGGSEPSKYR